MLGKSHAILGTSTTALILFTNQINLFEHTGIFLVSLTIGTLAALLPDVDTPNATIRTTFGVGREQSWRELQRWQRKNIFEVALDAVQWFVARLLDIVHMLLPHRGPTHWGITWLGLSLLMWLLCYLFNWPPIIALCFAVGYFSHLIGDGVTKSGVRLFAPFWYESIRFLPKPLTIRTGSWGEALMLSVMLFFIIGYFFFYLYYFI